MRHILIGLFVMMAAPLAAQSVVEPVATPHFPDRLHAYVWRNWSLVPTGRLAETIGATPEQIVDQSTSTSMKCWPRVGSPAGDGPTVTASSCGSTPSSLNKRLHPLSLILHPFLSPCTQFFPSLTPWPSGLNKNP